MENEKINAVVNANNAAVAAGDIDAVIATFEANGALVFQPGMMAKGTSELRGAFEQFIGMKPQITVIAHDVIQTGDIAVHTSTWTMKGQAPDGSVFEDKGFSTVVLRRQADGEWLMVIDNPFGNHLAQNG
jgi:uncharacterized protein (TIGR02246 family)